MNSGGGRAAGDEPGTFRQPRVDLASLLGKASEFARLWQMQSGCGAQVLDELADAVVSYLGDNPQLAQAGGEALRRDADVVIIDDPVRDQVPASCDAHPAYEVCPDCAPLIAAAMNEARVHVRTATDAEQRAALDRGLRQLNPPPHIELLVHATVAGDVLVTNRSTVELEVVHDDGSSIGLPPSARGVVPSRASVRTPPGGDWTRPRPVSDVELVVAQRIGMAAFRSSPAVDFLWVTRLQDGRALFLMPWHQAGVQLSVGMLGSLEFLGTWDYHAEHRDAGWRAALSWDGHGEPEGWTRHPETGRVRPDGTPATEAFEGRGRQ